MKIAKQTPPHHKFGEPWTPAEEIIIRRYRLERRGTRTPYKQILIDEPGRIRLAYDGGKILEWTIDENGKIEFVVVMAYEGAK